MSGGFEFATAGRIVFGPGRLRELGTLTAALGRRFWLVRGASPGRADVARQSLADAGELAGETSITGEPTIATVAQAAAAAREAGADVVIGFGGGSVVDAGKAIAALATNAGEVLQYLEVIGDGRPLQAAPLPYVGVPTTAGTGAEVTRNAVLHSPEHRLKVSLRSPLMLPRVALVDPETTRSVSPEVTAATGMDALTQLIEPFLSCRANAMTDALCRQAIPLVARSLERAVRDGANLEGRTDLAMGSLFSGMALANAGLGAVHGLAAPIGGLSGAPHGAICAALLAPVLRINYATATAMRREVTLERFDELGRLLGTSGNGGRSGEAAIEWIAELQTRLGIRGLCALGLAEADFGESVARAMQASSMKGNPVPLTEDDLMQAVQAAR